MRRFAMILMALYLATFLGLTLGGFYSPNATPNLMPFRTIRHDVGAGGSEVVINILGNLAAGWPMGCLAADRRSRPVLVGQGGTLRSRDQPVHRDPSGNFGTPRG